MTMECDTAIELLPWLLNGTLDAGERRQVEEHLRTCAACRTALADTRAAWQLFDWHPSPDELIALAAADAADAADPAPPTQAAPGSIQQHVVACPRCAADLELVRASRLLAETAPDAADSTGADRAGNGSLAFLQPPAAPPAALPKGQTAPARTAGRTWPRNALIAAGLAGVVALTGWFQSSRHVHALEDRLASLEVAQTAAATRTATATTVPPAPAAPGPATTQQTPAGAATLQASGGAATDDAANLRRRADAAQAKLDQLAGENRQLAAKVAALGQTAAQLEQRTSGLGTGAAGEPVEKAAWNDELSPNDQAARGAAPPAPAIPLSKGAAALALRTRQHGRYGTYEVEIHDARGRLAGGPYTVTRADRDDTFDQFDVILHRATLAPGNYTLQLFGRDDRQPGKPREPVATYSIRVS